ncbi:MAG: hypothetical protein U1F68_13055 [Gammaproteobacteria bacterium]
MGADAGSVDTGQVAVAISRSRLLTSTFPVYKTRDYEVRMDGQSKPNPASGFIYKTVPHITLKSIAQNAALDPIFAKHEPILTAKLATLNQALTVHADDALREKLIGKLTDKSGKRAKIASPPERRRAPLAVTGHERHAGSTGTSRT